uniref:Uncharacterized protein n=1 Tax=Oryza meridionalis TaxID=40149 RepID=A0A0E0CK12_9ORYZ
MEVLGRQPCKSEQELGWESFHPSSAHHLFDEMSSPLEMFEEDVLLVMREEKITWDEAVHLLQEELRDAQRRMNDKLDRLMEMLDSTETTRSKTSSAHLNGSKTTETTNVILKAASQPPQASPSSAPTKCSTVGLDIKGGVDHAGVTCQTMTGVSRDVPASIQAVADFAPRPIANIKQNQLMPTRCSMKFLGHDNKVSMYTNTQELELGKWELRSAPWVAFGCCWPRVHRLPPWPPPTEVSCLALLCHGTGMISIELMDVDLRWGELKPWPPPNNSDSKHTMIIQPVDRRVLMQLLVVGDSLYLTEMNCIAPGNWLSDKWSVWKKRVR